MLRGGVSFLGQFDGKRGERACRLPRLNGKLCSGGPRVSVMQSTNLGSRDHFTLIGRLDFSGNRSIAIEREMCPGSVVVFEVAGQNPNQVILVDDDHMIETLTSDRADQPFNERILPRGPKGGHDLLDIHVLNALPEVLAVNAVTISKQKAWCFVIRERFDDLLSGPPSGRVLGHVELDNLTAVVAKHNEAVQQAETHGRNDKEVNGCDILDVVVEEGSPSLRRRFAITRHVPCHRRFSDHVSKQMKLGLDARGAPRWILPGHLPDQIANLGVNPWPANPGGSGLPSPVEPETLPMPTDDRVGLDNDENRPPSLPQSGKPDPEYAVALAQSGALGLLLQDRQLLAKG
jgi:hypothetical protein